VIIRPPVNQSVCEGGTVNFTCVVMFPSGSTPSSADWFTNNRVTNTRDLSGYFITSDVAGRSAPTNVTNVLTITDVSINNNGRDHVCAQGVIAMSDMAFLTVFGELCIMSLCLFVLFSVN